MKREKKMSKLYAGLSALNNGIMSFDEVVLYYSDIPLSIFIAETILKKKEGKDMPNITNQAYVDLRNFTPEALRKIKSITNVHLVLLPENPTPEFSEAYAEIKKTNVVSETAVSGNACIFNGLSTLTKNELTEGSLVVCNGLTIIRDVPKEMNIRLIVNGALLKSPSAFIEPIKINGTSHIIDDEAKIIKSVSELRIDKNFIDNLTEKTAIVACGKIFINDEVTNEMLQSRGIVFYDVAKIIAREELHGYIQANSNNVASVATDDYTKKRKFFRWK